jgi:arginyl-tRNA--protein-N-Asp/Glu arginylyltransferase
MITTEYLVSDGQLRSTLWTRTDLTRHSWSASLRKLMARNGRRFRFEVGPLVLDAAHQELYRRYRDSVGGERAESLDDILGGEAGRRLFDTHEISIYREGKLVAFSWFDVGEIAVQSLLGVYDPEQRKHGLGFYTLLLEVAHASALGIRFHYCGYVLSEPSNLDYKRRVGPLDYFEPKSGRWLSEAPYGPGRSPAEILRRRLGEAGRALSGAGLRVRCAYNSALQIPGLRERIPNCTTEPILLSCAARAETEPTPGVLVTWNEERGSYVLFGGTPLHLLVRGGEDGEEPTPIHLFAVRQELGDCGQAEELVSRVTVFLQSTERSADLFAD